jgi:hypothetical protein
VAGLEFGITHLLGEPQWLTAQYVKAKRSATVHNVREQERKEAVNVNIVVGPDRKRATIATEAEKSKFRLLPLEAASAGGLVFLRRHHLKNFRVFLQHRLKLLVNLGQWPIFKFEWPN